MTQTEKIIPLGTPQEKRSPFFKESELFCQQWEDFVLSNNGKIKGKFSCWTMAVTAAIGHWEINLEKATVSNTSLMARWLAGGNVVRKTIFKSTQVRNFSTAFNIKKRRLIDRLFLRGDQLIANYIFFSSNGSSFTDLFDAEQRKVIQKAMNLGFKKMEYHKKDHQLEIEFEQLLSDFKLTGELVSKEMFA